MKTAELTGVALDWAVAQCEGWTGDLIDLPNYSTDWARGGPIIERIKPDFKLQSNGSVTAIIYKKETLNDDVSRVLMVSERVWTIAKKEKHI